MILIGQIGRDTGPLPCNVAVTLHCVDHQAMDDAMRYNMLCLLDVGEDYVYQGC